LFAQEGDKKKERKRYENFKERNISKTYTASGNTLNIDNRFGNIKITTWDKNELKWTFIWRPVLRIKNLLKKVLSGWMWKKAKTE
jgi:hypothetical protein